MSALDEMKMPPDNVAAEMYGEAMELWKIQAAYAKGRAAVLKYVKTGEDGNRHFNSRMFQQEMDAMRPADVEAMFGLKFKRVINAAKRVTGRGYKFKAKAKYKADIAIVRLLTGWGFLAGVATKTKRVAGFASHRFGRKLKTEMIGPTATRGKGADR